MELSAAIELSFPASQNRFAGLTGPAIKGAARVARDRATPRARGRSACGGIERPPDRPGVAVWVRW